MIFQCSVKIFDFVHAYMFTHAFLEEAGREFQERDVLKDRWPNVYWNEKVELRDERKIQITENDDDCRLCCGTLIFH